MNFEADNSETIDVAGKNDSINQDGLMRASIPLNQDTPGQEESSSRYDKGYEEETGSDLTNTDDSSNNTSGD